MTGLVYEVRPDSESPGGLISGTALVASAVLSLPKRGAFDSAKNHKRQRRKRQFVTAKREKSQTPKFVKVRLGQVRLV